MRNKLKYKMLGNIIVFIRARAGAPNNYVEQLNPSAVVPTQLQWNTYPQV